MYNNQYLIIYVPGKINKSIITPKKLTFTFLTQRATAHNPICHITIINFKNKSFNSNEAQFPSQQYEYNKGLSWRQ